MDESPDLAKPLRYIETVETGDASSRLSSAVFFLVCFIPVFSTVIFGAVDNMTWIIISVFWAAICLLWLGEAWKTGGLIFSPNTLQIPLFGLVVIGGIQLLPFGGDDGNMGLLGAQVSRSLSMDPYATRFFVLRLIVYFVFFAACLTYINNEKRLRKVVLLVIGFGSLMAFFGILQRLANPDGIYGIRGTPQAIPFGPFVNQHHFAAFMQMTAGLSLGLLFGKDTGRDKKLFLALSVVIMGVATVLTSSRGGLIGFLSVLAFVSALNLVSGRWTGKSRTRPSGAAIQRNIAIAAAGVAMMFVIFGVVLLLGGDDALLRGIGATNADIDISSGRTHFWPIALRIFFDHPIFGAGFDAFGVAFTKYDAWSGALRVEQAHNEYLQTLADAGIAGFICIAGFIFLLFKRGLATIANAADGFRNYAATGALAGCFGIMIHSFFDFPLRTPSNAFFFLLLAAIATVVIRADDQISNKRRRHTSI